MTMATHAFDRAVASRDPTIAIPTLLLPMTPNLPLVSLPPTTFATPKSPPPGESKFDINQPSTGESQLSQSLLSNNDAVFTIIGSIHEGHSTTSPRNATVTAIAPDPVPFHNTFGPLADGDASRVDSDVQPPETTHDRDDVDAPTNRIDELFRDADATLAAATFDFNLVEERLRVHLERDLTQTITTKLLRRGQNSNNPWRRLCCCSKRMLTT